MSKIRIYELAKQLGVANKELMARMREIGIEATSHMSMLEEEAAERVAKLFQKEEKPEAPKETPQAEAPKATPKAGTPKTELPKAAPKQEGQKKEPNRGRGEQRPVSRQEGAKANQAAQQGGANAPRQNQPRQGGANGTNPRREGGANGANAPRQGGQGNANAPRQGGQNGTSAPKQAGQRPNMQGGQNKPQNAQNKNAGKNKKGMKKEPRVRENPMERRRRELEEQAALKKEQEAAQAAQNAADPVIKSIPESISVKGLAEILGKKASDLVMNLMKKGKMLNVNAAVDFDTAAEIAEEYNVILEKEEEKDIMETVFAEDTDDESSLKERPPVVVVMGHVDHGKTSLLDAIRHSNVTKGEAGGITQHIGAYTVQIDGKPITFLDTPGHEAFTAMRMRGAQITDIAILVVAADDGVMPQTIEAINHAKAAGVEIIVAINKMDKPSANPDRVKQELVEYELLAEDWGGETICVPVSAVTKEGIDTLLEMIILVAEMKELKANPNKNARGAIVEAQLDKGRGPVATVLVQNGTLQVGDPIVAGSAYGKIRAMTDDKGRRVKKAGPSTPVEILGLSEVPSAGDSFYVAESEKQARQVAESIIARNRENLIKETPQKVSLDDLFSQIQSGNMKELNIVVKADVQGSVEAVRQSLERLSNEEVRVRIIHGGVGAITESDVMLASASNAIIIGFNVRPEPAAKAFSDEEKVDVRLYRVIYNAIEDITAAMKGMLDPVYEEQVLGHAEVRQLFKASGVGTIAGSYVKDGKFVRNCQVRILRDSVVVYEGDLESLRRFKDDVKEVTAGYECGLVFKKFNDIKEGDWVEAFTMVEIPR